VDELAGLYSYPTVHQLISTISAQLAKDKTWLDAIKACFPMGSMTGAPKVAAMKLIENFENTKRGVYSGALGYISPDRDFDFNVLIRTALYDAATKHLSVMVGGAITALSIPGEEFEECLIKINFWFRLLNTDGDIFS
jgi:para-aminobenzoate synthetase component 1